MKEMVGRKEQQISLATLSRENMKLDETQEIKLCLVIFPIEFTRCDLTKHISTLNFSGWQGFDSSSITLALLVAKKNMKWWKKRETFSIQLNSNFLSHQINPCRKNEPLPEQVEIDFLSLISLLKVNAIEAANNYTRNIISSPKSLNLCFIFFIFFFIF